MRKIEKNTAKNIFSRKLSENKSQHVKVSLNLADV